jgi:hypothetical protein
VSDVDHDLVVGGHDVIVARVDIGVRGRHVPQPMGPGAGAAPPARSPDWEEIAWEYGHAYLTTPRAALLAELMPDLAAVQRKASLSTGTDRLSLSRTPARLASLAAWSCGHVGLTVEARHLWRLGRVSWILSAVSGRSSVCLIVMI